MMTQQLGFSVLTAPLAAMDRRALSQAWLSALGDANGSARSAQQRSASRNTTAHVARATGVATERAVHLHSLQAAVAKRVDRREQTRAGAAEPADRRGIRSKLARDIERAFLKPGAQVQRATFTVEGTARVHITLQTEGDRVCLVAVCPPAQRATVAAALAQARFALAGRGFDVALSVR